MHKHKSRIQIINHYSTKHTLIYPKHSQRMILDVQLQYRRSHAVPPPSTRHVVRTHEEAEHLQKKHKRQQDQAVRPRAISKHEASHLHAASQNSMVHRTLPVRRRSAVRTHHHAEHKRHLKRVRRVQGEAARRVQDRRTLRSLQRQPSQGRQPGGQTRQGEGEHHARLRTTLQRQPSTQRIAVPLPALQHEVHEKQIEQPATLQTPGIHYQTREHGHERRIVEKTETHFPQQRTLYRLALRKENGTNTNHIRKTQN